MLSAQLEMQIQKLHQTQLEMDSMLLSTLLSSIWKWVVPEYRFVYQKL